MGYHLIVVALSAAIALLLPTIARGFLAYWAMVEKSKTSLIVAEVILAAGLIVCLNYLHQAIHDRRLARMAVGAGLVAFTPNRSRNTPRHVRAFKEMPGLVRNIMVIGSTGYETFVEPESDFHRAMETCLSSHIALLNPYSEEAEVRVRAMAHDEFTLERVHIEIQKTIDFLRKLRARGRDITLKFYSDAPVVKLVILGDYLWLQHFHASVEVRTMPEFIFHHNQMDRGLYALFYQYFIKRWQSPQMPEYDFETDELVYRSKNGCEVERVPWGPAAACAGTRQSAKPGGMTAGANGAVWPSPLQGAIPADSCEDAPIQPS
jgi:hypothetical protein